MIPVQVVRKDRQVNPSLWLDCCKNKIQTVLKSESVPLPHTASQIKKLEKLVVGNDGQNCKHKLMSTKS